MYTQVEKPKENRNRAAAASVTQKKSSSKQGFEIVDNRPAAIMQRKSQTMKDANVKISTPVQFALDDDGRAYKAHVLDQVTPTWGSYVEANAIATARGFQTRVFQKNENNLQLIDQVGAGDVRNLSLLWDGGHYTVLTGGDALDGTAFNDGLVRHNPQPDGNCLYEAMFCIMRMGTPHILERLNNATERAVDIQNMRSIAASNIDDDMANVLGAEIVDGTDYSEAPKEYDDQLKTMQEPLLFFYKEFPSTGFYIKTEKKKAYLYSRKDNTKASSVDINSHFLRNYKPKLAKETRSNVVDYLSKSNAYIFREKAFSQKVETPFVSLAQDHLDGLYQLVVTNAAGKIRQQTGESPFEDYSAGKSVKSAVDEAIAGLDLTGSITFKHSRHDFQPSNSSNRNLQIQLGGSAGSYRRGQGDTSSTVVIIDAAIFINSPRWLKIVQAAHKQSFLNTEKIEIKTPIKR